MPERLGAHYIAEDGSKQVPVMVHRAILGSLERFIGILIEHHEGKLPSWLSPIQVAVMNITDRQAEFVSETVSAMKAQGIRAIADLRNEKIGFKIRDYTLKRVPYLLVVGDREVENQSVAVRARSGADLGTMPVDEFLRRLERDLSSRGRDALED
jgi:threonyl-tRNA synthetase